MRTLEKSEFHANKLIHKDKVLKGSVFIYPTDTIYGIGCDATNGEAISKIRSLKERPTQPFSIIAPSKEWIRENCHIDEVSETWLDKLPGAYTFILNLKNKDAIHSMFHPESNDTIGVRIPDHWISDFVAELNRPVITTSANKHGDDIMTHPDNLDVEFRSDVHFLVYEGRLHNSPSTIVDLTNNDSPKFLRGSNNKKD